MDRFQKKKKLQQIANIIFLFYKYFHKFIEIFITFGRDMFIYCCFIFLFYFNKVNEKILKS